MAAPKIQCELVPFRVDLFKPFRISRDVYDHKLGVRVILRSGSIRGVGETQEHNYYNVQLKDLEKQLLELKPLVEKQPLMHPADMFSLAVETIGWHPFSLAALDMAYWDLYAKSAGKPTRALFDLPPPDPEPKYTSYTISIDTEKEMIRQTGALRYKNLKVKLGTHQDLELMEKLLASSDADFYVDANCAWDLGEANRFARHFEGKGIEMIEQPMPASSWEGMHRLRSATGIPLIADESFIHIDDLARCSEAFDGINIKLLKCGGLTPSIEIIRKAREREMKIMVGCMMETSIGISAAMQVTPWSDYVDIDSFMFIRSDPAGGCRVLDDGEVILPEMDGNGHSFAG